MKNAGDPEGRNECGCLEDTKKAQRAGRQGVKERGER